MKNGPIAPRRRSSPPPGSRNTVRRSAAPAPAGKRPALVRFLIALVAGLFVLNLAVLAAGLGKGSGGTDLAQAGGPRQAATSPASSPRAEPSWDIDSRTSLHCVVNRARPIGEDYVPAGLMEPDVAFAKERGVLRAEAALAFQAMYEAAQAEGVRFHFYSGYRSAQFQREIYDNSLKVYGEAWVKAYVAPPGSSEHQTGLGIDISCPETNFLLKDAFESTPAGLWLSRRAADFGFILRYPKGKEDVTGYAYEPWHYRYVGPELAKRIKSSGLTMEEYFGLPPVHRL